MIEAFKIGDKKVFSRTVMSEDIASFESGAVHPVYATFALGRDVEWACRLFVLEMKEEHEEGIGTFLHIQHISPALLGQEVCIEATLEELKGNKVNCSFEVKVGDRLVAKGTQGQAILAKEKINQLFGSLKD